MCHPQVRTGLADALILPQWATTTTTRIRPQSRQLANRQPGPTHGHSRINLESLWGPLDNGGGCRKRVRCAEWITITFWIIVLLVMGPRYYQRIQHERKRAMELIRTVGRSGIWTHSRKEIA
jgi:hypothetical protein